MEAVYLLDATVRDGGYMFDHHFTRGNIATIVGGLDAAGVPLIEVGYGMGVFPQRWNPRHQPSQFPSLSAREHAAAALPQARSAKVGVLCVASKEGVPIDALEEVAELGFAFVRFAVMPNEYDDYVLRYVERAKSLGLMAAINLMQTPLCPPEEVAARTAAAAAAGLDWFFVVDSAGGMSQAMVQRYVSAVRERSTVAVGLHSHNNSGQAIGNSLAAIEAGATLIDGTLNGLGRSTGNPATELMALLVRDRLPNPIDFDQLCALSSSLRSTMVAGNDPMDYASGVANIHSRDVARTLHAARERERAPALFLIEVGRETRARKASPSEPFSASIFDGAAERVPAAIAHEPSDALIDTVAAEVLSWSRGELESLLTDLRAWRAQHHKPSVVFASSGPLPSRSRVLVWEGAAIGVALPVAASQWPAFPPELIPDWVAIEPGQPRPELAPRLGFLTVSTEALHRRATEDLRMALDNRGVHVITSGVERPDHPGPVALFGSLADRRACALRPGDYWVATGEEPAEDMTVHAGEGVLVLELDWAGALGSVVERQMSLATALDHPAPSGSPLVEAPWMPGEGQAAWNPTRGTLGHGPLDEDRAAREIARAVVRGLWSGKRRF